MSLKSLVVSLCVFILVCLCSVAPALELDLAKFMPVDEIKPGMKGIGKTVFDGTKIEEFQIEVLYVDKNGSGPKSDIIWVLCSGGRLEETGVLEGMSGSPVYIDGRLIGAIAFRTGMFAKQPIAGVRPIADMLPMLDAGYSMSDAGLDSRYQNLISRIQHPESSVQDPASRIQRPVSSIEYPVMPIQMPVMMSGFHPRAINDIAPVLTEFGMIPVQGGGTSSTAESEAAKLEPGAAICVELVRGDMSAFGAGTVTYVDGDRVLAFGHPMVGMGKISLPISGGRVGFLVSSLIGSFKYVSSANIVGSLTFDSEFGLMGVLGEQPEFIPVKIRIHSQRNNQMREYNFEVAKHKLFSPTYIYMTALNAIYTAEKSVGDYTMRTHSEINLKGYPTISKDNIFSGTSPGTVAAAFASPLIPIMQNNFEEVDVENVLLEISFDDKRVNAAIDSVQINRDQIRPGDPLGITVFLTPYMQDTVVKRFEVTIPKDMPEGRSFLWISDAASSESWERSRAPMKSRITGLPHLIRQIQEAESNNDIIVEVFAPKAGITIGDQELPALPLTTFSVMSSPKQMGGSGLTRGTTFLKQRVSTEYVISGSATLPIVIDRDATY